jgi:hypothetical protein
MAEVVMDKRVFERLGIQAISLVKAHFDAINNGDIEAAKRQCFHPSALSQKPLDIYVEAMTKLSPFQIVSLSVRRIDPLRENKHDCIANIWMDIIVETKLRRESTFMTVWWFHKTGELKISSRPSHLISEVLRGPDDD